jgi:leucyl aminopeptidase
MKISSIKNTTTFFGIHLIPLFENKSEKSKSLFYNENEIAPELFSGKKNTHYLVKQETTLFLFIGLGKTIDYKSLKTTFRRIASQQKELFDKKAALILDSKFSEDQVEAMIAGLQLGTYDLGHFKSKKEVHPFLKTGFELQLVTQNDYLATAQKGLKIAYAQLETLRLVDLPPNVVTPKYLANWAIESGKKFGFEVEVLGREASKKAGLGSFLAVGQGSENEPQFVIMKYNPKKSNTKTQHIGLVGKGITFDTGGLNIKTAAMVQMKSDMAGGGAVFGAMQLIADLQLPIRVTAIVPCAENAVDAKAFLPSDIIHSYSGHSIEVIDTDAEGRLVLADGLSYLIQNFKPNCVVDIATLTGSCVGTFGSECAGIFSKNDSISKQIQNVGDAIGERSWPLPMWDNYNSDIESDIADVKNYHGKPHAGAINGAKFLEFFTQKHTAWAHLDIAGVAFGDGEFAKSKHATAFGVHLLTKFVENYK